MKYLDGDGVKKLCTRIDAELQRIQSGIANDIDSVKNRVKTCENENSNILVNLLPPTDYRSHDSQCNNLVNVLESMWLPMSRGDANGYYYLCEQVLYECTNISIDSINRALHWQNKGNPSEILLKENPEDDSVTRFIPNTLEALALSHVYMFVAMYSADPDSFQNLDIPFYFVIRNFKKWNKAATDLETYKTETDKAIQSVRMACAEITGYVENYSYSRVDRLLYRMQSELDYTEEEALDALKYVPTLTDYDIEETYAMYVSWKEILESDEPTKMDNFFYGCKLKIAPKLDFQNVTSAINLFAECAELQYVPEFTGTDRIQQISHMFNRCTKLKQPLRLDFPAAQYIGNFISNCGELEAITLNAAPKGITNLLWGCCSIKKLYGLDMANIVQTTSDQLTQYTMPYMQVVHVKNIGKKRVPSSRFHAGQAWKFPNIVNNGEGVNLFLDTWIFDTFDRVAAGYTEPYYIEMTPDQYSILDPDPEFATAAAKGYTVIEVS